MQAYMQVLVGRDGIFDLYLVPLSNTVRPRFKAWRHGLIRRVIVYYEQNSALPCNYHPSFLAVLPSRFARPCVLAKIKHGSTSFKIRTSVRIRTNKKQRVHSSHLIKAPHAMITLSSTLRANVKTSYRCLYDNVCANAHVGMHILTRSLQYQRMHAHGLCQT